MVMLQIAESMEPVGAFEDIALDGIEPFTLIIYKDSTLADCRWDGERKHVLNPDPKVPHIWSSCTLYDMSMQLERKKWFRAFMDGNPDPEKEQVLVFHTSGGDGNPRHDILMNRDDLLGTVSITSLFIKERTGLMQYLDLRTGSTAVQEIVFDQPTA